MERLARDNRGFALVLTLLVLSVIVALTLQFNASARDELIEAANLRDGTQLSYIARSGFDGALAILSEDKKTSPNVDHLHEDWANLGFLTAISHRIFEKGNFNVKIIDHAGRIQINTFFDQTHAEYSKRQALFRRFLDSEEFDPDDELNDQDVTEIIDAIKDWIDADNESLYDAEKDYYQYLDPPYAPRNGPLESLDELLKVKGIEPDLFYGTEDRPGIKHYLTVYGTDGMININTADSGLEEELAREGGVPRPRLILRALAEGLTDGDVEKIVDFRNDEDNEGELGGTGWLTSPDVLGGTYTIDVGLVTTQSDFFEIISTGFKEDMDMIKRVRGIVQWKAPDLKTLSWKVERAE